MFSYFWGSSIDKDITCTNLTAENASIGNINVRSGASSAVSAGAATVNERAGHLTSATMSASALSTQTITVTNSTVTTRSIVHVVMDSAYGGTGVPYIRSVHVPLAGQFVITVANAHASTALSSTANFAFIVFGE